MNGKQKILIEGFDEQELLKSARLKEFQEIVFNDSPIIFKAGSSEILGQFKQTENELKIVFSHIIGGGEGVLLKLLNLFRQFAIEHKKEKIIWIVHAVDCPKPNIKLQPILEKKGFKIFDDKKDGKVYQKIEIID